jgi:beta-ribofuranosylaminobenzene 5'-phosphate synthase
MSSSVTITAPSRLHFGLFAVSGGDAAPKPEAAAIPPRRFGGVGLMLERPGVRLSAQPAREWSACGAGALRALGFAQRFVTTLPEERRRPFAVVVERCPPEHSGLGTGTQLGLAVAKALAALTGLEHEDAAALAQRVGRGLRSSLGIHGFEHGGFLVEAGKTAPAAIAPLVVRHDFPEPWRVLLVIPHGLHGEHGAREIEAFAKLAPTDHDAARTDALSRLALLGMLPALVERDLLNFGEAVHEFNRKAGEWFAAWQGGVYSHPRVADLIAALRREGLRGVGQSSWGPAVFAIDEEDRLQAVRRTFIEAGHFTGEESEICGAENRDVVRRNPAES